MVARLVRVCPREEASQKAHQFGAFLCNETGLLEVDEEETRQHVVHLSAVPPVIKNADHTVVVSRAGGAYAHPFSSLPASHVLSRLSLMLAVSTDLLDAQALTGEQNAVYDPLAPGLRGKGRRYRTERITTVTVGCRWSSSVPSGWNPAA